MQVLQASVAGGTESPDFARLRELWLDHSAASLLPTLRASLAAGFLHVLWHRTISGRLAVGVAVLVPLRSRLATLSGPSEAPGTAAATASESQTTEASLSAPEKYRAQQASDLYFAVGRLARWLNTSEASLIARGIIVGPGGLRPDCGGHALGFRVLQHCMRFARWQRCSVALGRPVNPIMRGIAMSIPGVWEISRAEEMPVAATGGQPTGIVLFDDGLRMHRRVQMLSGAAARSRL